MKEKQHIYRWLFLPLLTCLMAVVAGCSNELTEKATPSAEGGTYLTVTARGITTTSPGTGGNYDDYVKTVRVIGYNAGTQICNKLFEADDINVATDGSKATIQLEIQGNGTVSFYFIANEATDNTLSAFLGNASLAEETLKQKTLTYAASFAPSEDTPFLMTAGPLTVFVREGMPEQEISLVRVLSKVDVTITKDEAMIENIQITNAKIKGNIPSTYTLFEPGAAYDGTSYSSQEVTLNLNNKTTVPCSARTVYLPERILADGNNDTQHALTLDFMAGVDADVKPYSIPLDFSEDNQPATYSLNRNTAATYTLTFRGWLEGLLVKASVAPWEVVRLDYEFGPAVFTTPLSDLNNEEVAGKENITLYYPSNSQEESEVLVYQFKLTGPTGAKWVATLSNGTVFELVDGTVEIDGTSYSCASSGKTSDNTQYIAVRGKQRYDAQLDRVTSLSLLVNNKEEVKINKITMVNTKN